MQYFEFNKLSSLHDEENIFFCKTDYILEDFKKIQRLSNQVIFLTGNSDYSITDELVSMAPKNIKKWYATNCISKNQILEPIPLGLENQEESIRPNHGIGYKERGKLKEDLLKRNKLVKPNKYIYANFKIETNLRFRSNYREHCIKSPLIDWEEPNLTINQFFDKILEYEIIFCPNGNGIDNHRLWEVLYSKRIPMIIKIGDYKIYDLYKKLPIIILDSIEDLYNKDKIDFLFNSLNYSNINMLDINYWKRRIVSEI